MKTKEVCSHCGHEFPRTELTEVDGGDFGVRRLRKAHLERQQ